MLGIISIFFKAQALVAMIIDILQRKEKGSYIPNVMVCVSGSFVVIIRTIQFINSGFSFSIGLDILAWTAIVIMHVFIIRSKLKCEEMKALTLRRKGEF